MMYCLRGGTRLSRQDDTPLCVTRTRFGPSRVAECGVDTRTTAEMASK